jgi:hypothetical protein
MERKVFVVNYSGHDLSAATKFGKLVFLTESREINVFDTDGLLVDLRTKLAEADDGDFLLLSGSPVLNILASAILLMKYGILNLLIFNSKSREYVARTVTETQLQNIT